MMRYIMPILLTAAYGLFEAKYWADKLNLAIPIMRYDEMGQEIVNTNYRFSKRFEELVSSMSSIDYRAVKYYLDEVEESGITADVEEVKQLRIASNVFQSLIKMEEAYLDIIKDKTLNAPQLMFIATYASKIGNSNVTRSFGIVPYVSNLSQDLELLKSLKQFSDNYDLVLSLSDKVCSRSDDLQCDVSIPYQKIYEDFKVVCVSNSQCNSILKVTKFQTYSQHYFDTLLQLMKVDPDNQVLRNEEIVPHKIFDFLKSRAKFQHISCARMQACKARKRICKTKLGPVIDSDSKTDSIFCETKSFFETESLMSSTFPKNSFIKTTVFEKYLLYKNFVAWRNQNLTAVDKLDKELSEYFAAPELERTLWKYLNYTASPSKTYAVHEDMISSFIKSCVQNLHSIVQSGKLPGEFPHKEDLFSKVLIRKFGQILKTQINHRFSIKKYINLIVEFFKEILGYKSFTLAGAARDYQILFMNMAFDGKIVAPGKASSVLQDTAKVYAKLIDPIYKVAIKSYIQKYYKPDDRPFLLTLADNLINV